MEGEQGGAAVAVQAAAASDGGDVAGMEGEQGGAAVAAQAAAASDGNDVAGMEGEQGGAAVAAQDAVRRDFEPRCAALQRLLCLPPLAAEPYDALAAAAGKERLAQLLLHGLPVQQAQQQQAQQQRDASPEAARAAAGVGVALLGSAAFEARARLLALCGWDLKLISTAGKAAAGSSGAAAAGSPAGQEDHGLPAHVGPESAALECGVCSAKAGLWAFFPQCKPHVLQAARRSGGAGGTLASPSSAAVAKAAVSRSVAADIGTTITGGAMQTGAPAAAVPAAAPPP